jgi:hypothetical protein
VPAPPNIPTLNTEGRPQRLGDLVTEEFRTDELQDRLDQLEDLAAELRAIAEVITPPADRLGTVDWPPTAEPPPPNGSRWRLFGPGQGTDRTRSATGRAPVQTTASAGFGPPRQPGRAAPPGTPPDTLSDLLMSDLVTSDLVPFAPAEAPSKGPRWRYTAMAIAVIALAIPAFALAAIEPWHSTTDGSGRVSVLGGDRANNGLRTGDAPAPAVANRDLSRRGAAVTPSRTASASPSPGNPTPIGVAPPPNPTRAPGPPDSDHDGGSGGLVVSVRADQVRPHVSEPVQFTVSWDDPSGRYAGSEQRWDDGTTEGSVHVDRCTGTAPPSRGSMVVSHAFTRPGGYQLTFSVTTYTCDGSTETRVFPLKVLVRSNSSWPDVSPSTGAAGLRLTGEAGGE